MSDAELDEIRASYAELDERFGEHFDTESTGRLKRDIYALIAEIERLTTCDCGYGRTIGACTGTCDNDE